MRKEVSISIFAVLIVAAAILTFYYLNVGLTGFAVFEQNNNASFSEGTYSNLLHNGTSIVLAANQTNGTYTSKTLDANGSATWNNLTWQGNGVTFEVRACSAANCAGTNFTTGSLNNLNLTGRYFQYRASFDSVNDTLSSVTVDYTAATNNATNTTNTTQQTTPLSVSLFQPTGEKSSLTAIPLNFTIAGGTGTNLTCSYNISYAGGTLVSNVGVSCSNGTNTKVFDLASKGGDNTLTLYVSDTSGNASASSGFSVSLPSGGTKGGETTKPEEQTPPPVQETAPSVTQVSLADVAGQDLIQGNSKQLTISAQNTGTVPLTSCTLAGDDSGLVTITDNAKNINPGEGATFSFLVNVSEETNPGAYTLGLSLSCAETTASKTVALNVLQKKLDFNITNVQRTREDRVRVDYDLTELSGEDQDVSIFFSITDASGLQVANTSQNSSINANKTDNFRVNIPINESLNGTMTLSAAFNSQIYSSSVLEPIDLSTVTGATIFGGNGGAGSIVLVIVVIVVLGAIFFVVRKLRKSRD